MALSRCQIKQDISDLDYHKVGMSDEAKDAAERVIDDLKKLFSSSIKE